MIRRLQQSGKILYIFLKVLYIYYKYFHSILFEIFSFLSSNGPIRLQTCFLVMNLVILKRSDPPTHSILFKRQKLFVMFQFVEEEGWLPAQDDVNVITLHSSPPAFLHLLNSSPIINPLSWTRVRLVYHPEQNILEQGGHKSYLSYRLTQSLLSGLFDWDEFY